MTSNFSSESDLKNYLKPFAPYSVVDRGYEMAQNSQVDECSQSGNKIAASVVDENETFSPSITLGHTGISNASCSCCSDEDIAEQWCSHLVALSFKAWEMELLNLKPQDDVFNVNQFTPEDLAIKIKEAAKLEYHAKKNDYYPKVGIELKFDDYSLGVKVFHNGKVVTPEVFDNGQEKSARELDNILIQVLEEEGEWEETEKRWFINTSHSIGIVLGMSAEYNKAVRLLDNESSQNKTVEFSNSYLDPNISIEWQDTSVELVLYWLLNDQKILKTSGTIGDLSSWTVIDNIIYKLSDSAHTISKIFPFSSSISLSKQQAGPLLEIIEKNIVPPEMITVLNPKAQPETETKQPKVSLSIEPANDSLLDRNANFDFLKLRARLNFTYPVPDEHSNLVFLPDREFEQDCIDQLQALGFSYNEEKKTFIISGDEALDLIHQPDNKFPTTWETKGLNDIQTAFKFSKLKVNFDVRQSSGEDDLDNKNIDWFDCNITLTQNNANISLGKIFQTKSSIFDRWIQMDNGSWAEVPGGGLKKLGTTLALFAPNYKHAEQANNKISIAQAVALQNQHVTESINIKSDKKLKDMAKKLADFENIKEVTPPALFKGKLRKYQQEGLSWLSFLNEYAFSGILADEMGLGKTVQTLSLIQSLKSSKSKNRKLTKPVLVVAPTSVTTNWLYEARRFTPGLQALLLQGTKRKKLFSEIPEADIVITSYALLRVDRSVLEKYDFSYVILDEAQNIKNPLTSTAKAAKAIKAERRLALTGTPTENRPLELWSIFDFLMPGYLGTYDFFRNQIEKPILEEGRGADTIKLLNSKTRPFILRRLKSEVEKQLPPKIESEMHVSMTDSQRNLYAQILEEVRPQVMEAVDRKGVRGATVSILAALLRLRQVCNHPNSIESLKDLEGYDSGKFELLKELLQESLESGKKILLFSQFREMLAIIRRWIESEKINYLYLDGGTKNRQDLVDQFNMDTNVRMFLISLKAGGTGLNLTAADTVIIYDPWWNPAVESQAIDRAHRIGQSKAVNVYRLVTEDSIEQKIMSLKTKKANITDALINENGLSGINLTKDDLESLFEPLS